MKTLIAAAFFATLGLAAAQAMPVAPVPADGLTTQVAQGCGPGLCAQRRRPLPPGLHGALLPSRHASQLHRPLPPEPLTALRRTESTAPQQRRRFSLLSLSRGRGTMAHRVL